ncbi:pyrimidine 5'-nucleotidase [Erwinia tracheiphila]|uniref:DUMP phosphatase n=1 Tax=Erwinia tracheiphila TaxID=65700 RepID=A0A345CUJ5_9GAMM|nr:pyrimidine 5'-nucleotidase [Erwinia tracheiphila]AXF77112.1 dUMP phosphatase [Erwinia tracheiphila]UIA84202.1 pyrimidine 5'-nucleotidase [Erwinia tracheiphila]UIA92783.1 pyrimidine 5'-nucleotidase [Erwinia tracheiphila]
MLKDWDWILFDADDTLFHFDAHAGLKQMFSRYGVIFSAADFEEYQLVNKPLWVEYQNGAITAQQLQSQRFVSWAEKLRVPPDELNAGYLAAMAEICTPLVGAVALLNALKGRVKMGIITNGFTVLQRARLQRAGLLSCFELLVISEQVGYAKPHPAIFEHALQKMGNPPRARVLMVGDNPDADILGGIRAGLATCWLNAAQRATPEGLYPTWQVETLEQLQDILIS